MIQVFGRKHRHGPLALNEFVAYQTLGFYAIGPAMLLRLLRLFSLIVVQTHPGYAHPMHISNAALNQRELRSSIVAEMKHEMVSCPWEDFRRYYLPFSPTNADVDECIAHLKATHFLVRDDEQELRWADATISMNGLGHVAYAALVDICRELEEVPISGGRMANFRLLHHSNNAVEPTTWEGLHMMDGCFYPIAEITQDGGLAMRDIAVTNDYNTKFSEPENRHQLVANANFIMNENPRRMFMYGFTIEDERAAVWYFSRSHSAVSNGFTWVTSYRDFIIAMVSFIFATPEELGFDPTIKRFYTPSNAEYFVYKIEDTESRQVCYYKTLHSLSEYSSLCISGRATRVWLAIEVKSFEEPTPIENAKNVVLKDVWLYRDARTEREITKGIVDDVDKFVKALQADELDKPASDAFLSLPEPHRTTVRNLVEDGTYKQHFLTIVCDSVGFTSKSLADSARPCPAFLQEHLSPQSTPQSDPSHSQINPPQEPPAKDKVASKVLRRFVPKKQYRVVFGEVGEAVQEVTSFRDAMKAIKDGVIGLIILFLIGAVHRDISGGNILWYDGRGILSDLEYFKEASVMVASADPKTGTAFFMACELQTGEAFYTPLPSERPAQPIQLRHNFLHDIESIWWLHLWTILERIRHVPSQGRARRIFVNNMSGSSHRMMAFLVGVKQNYLHPSVKEIGLESEDVRKAILTAFRQLRDPSDRSTYGPLYGRLLDLCTRSFDLGNAVPELIKFTQHRRQSTAKTKRSRGDGNGDDTADHRAPKKTRFAK